MWNAVQENKAAVITELLRRFDPSYETDYPIYAVKANGAMSGLNAG
jgi:hypothetical protein